MDPEEKRQQLKIAQYEITASDRQVADTLLWQSPTIALTGQAFLLTIALNGEFGLVPRICAACVNFLISLVSVQLLLKHRYFERLASQTLQDMEEEFQREGLPSRILHAKPPEADDTWWFSCVINWKSVPLWMMLFLVIALLGLVPLGESIFGQASAASRDSSYSLPITINQWQSFGTPEHNQAKGTIGKIPDSNQLQPLEKTRPDVESDPAVQNPIPSQIPDPSR